MTDLQPSDSTSMGTVLVVDDDLDAAEMIADSLRARGYRAIAESSPEAAAKDALAADVEVVLSDLEMRSIDGLELTRRLSAARPDLPVIVVTGHASMEAAVSALRAGAFDFVVKPVDAELLAVAVARAIQHHRLKSEVHRLRSELAESGSRGLGLLGESSAMERVKDVVLRVAPTDATVLVTGESGTGKELVARSIHAESTRKDGPFVAINCAAVPASLLESELFGHQKGAFTDAKSARRGLFLDAQGGTLFLDEIGEMPLEMQVKLLRALQERTVRPVGGGAEVPFDARVIAATNRDLEIEVAEKRFREDLFYRIHVCAVAVPPLRDRDGDVPLLARAFVERFARRHQKAVKGIAAPALAKLVQYRWPGNVRELENGMERAVAMAQHDQITLEDLPEKVRSYRPSASVGLLPATASELVSLDELEQRYLAHVLTVVKGNKSRAARILGCDRRTLYRKLEHAEGAVRSGSTPPGNGSSPPIAAPSPPASGSAPPIAITPTPVPSGTRVLVVDDDPDNLELVKILLTARGYVVSTARGVAEAIRARDVDLVLTDLQLEDGSGADLVGRFGDVPVMVMTGAPQSDSFGFDAWLTKPVSLERLTSTLATVLS